MFSYNTIINFTELYKQEPNSTCTGLQFKVQQPAPAQVVLSPGLQITDSKLPVMMIGQIFFSPDKPRFWPVK